MHDEDRIGSLFNKKYFEGYSKKVVMDNENHLHTEFVYEGSYYQNKSTDTIKARNNAIYMSGTIVYLIILIFIMSQDNALNYLRYITLLEIILLFGSLGMISCAVIKILAKEKMTKWEYRIGVISLKEFAQISMIFTFLLGAISFAISLSENFTINPIFFIGTIFEFFLLWMIHLFIKHEKYSETQSDDMPNGIDMTNDF